MAKLGDAFSDDERRKSVARQLQPGTVIYLEIAFPQGARSKYLVVARVDDECCAFIVNSQIHPFVQAHPVTNGQNVMRVVSSLAATAIS